MDRFENMNYFIRVVEAGSISGAADRLGIAKSVVSRRLKELESHLGVELLHRTTRQMKLTTTGRSFYHQSLRILQDVREAELAASQAHGILEGSLKVALPVSFGLMHLGPAINAFMQAHPQIEFELDFNDRQVDIMEEGFDLAIRIARLPDSSFIARRLATIRSIICASPVYLDRMGVPQLPSDLINHRCLVYSLIRDSAHWYYPPQPEKRLRQKIRPGLKSGQW